MPGHRKMTGRRTSGARGGATMSQRAALLTIGVVGRIRAAVRQFASSLVLATRRVVAVVVVVAMVAAGALVAVPGVASAANGTGPADLINDVGLSDNPLARGLYSATPAQQASLEDLEQQAVVNTLADHGLPSSDAAAAQTWGRDDAEGELWALLTQAIQTPAAARSPDQQNAVDWLSTVVQRQGVQAADNAGLEYAKWAGLGADAYQQLLATNPSEATLQNFLSPPPANYGSGESVSTPESTSNEGYCVYESPAPDQSQYTGNIYTPWSSSAAPQTCFTPCTSILGCAPPTPSYDQFVQWGTADTDDSEFDNASFAAVSNDVAEGLGFGAAVVGAAVTGVVLSSTLAGALSGTALSAALAPIAAQTAAGITRAAAQILAETGVDLAENLAEVEAGVAAADVGGIVSIVLVAIAAGVIEGINVFNAAALPGQLATLVTNAPTAAPDLTSMLADPSQASGLYALFIDSTLPVPALQTCDNSIVISSIGAPNPAPCLNAPAIPAATSSDPSFTVTEKGATSSSTASSISWADAATATANTAYVSGDWFVQSETADSDGSSLTFQTLQIDYTDWSGTEQIAWLSGNPAAGYTFITTPADPATPLDPSSCLSAGTCASSSAIDFVGTDGNDYSASLAGTGVPPLPPGPRPSVRDRHDGDGVTGGGAGGPAGDVRGRRQWLLRWYGGLGEFRRRCRCRRHHVVHGHIVLRGLRCLRAGRPRTDNARRTGDLHRDLHDDWAAFGLRHLRRQRLGLRPLTGRDVY